MHAGYEPLAEVLVSDGRRLVQRLLQRTEDLLRPYLQRFLIALVDGESVDTELKQEPAELIVKV